MPQYVDRTTPLEEQVHRLFERHAEPTTITETTPETSRWIGRDVYALIRAVKAVLRHEMETDQPFRQPYHGLMQALVNVTGSDDLGDK